MDDEDLKPPPIEADDEPFQVAKRKRYEDSGGLEQPENEANTDSQAGNQTEQTEPGSAGKAKRFLSMEEKEKKIAKEIKKQYKNEIITRNKDKELKKKKLILTAISSTTDIEDSKSIKDLLQPQQQQQQQQPQPQQALEETAKQAKASPQSEKPTKARKPKIVTPSPSSDPIIQKESKLKTQMVVVSTGDEGLPPNDDINDDDKDVFGAKKAGKVLVVEETIRYDFSVENDFKTFKNELKKLPTLEAKRDLLLSAVDTGSNFNQIQDEDLLKLLSTLLTTKHTAHPRLIDSFQEAVLKFLRKLSVPFQLLKSSGISKGVQTISKANSSSAVVKQLAKLLIEGWVKMVHDLQDKKRQAKRPAIVNTENEKGNEVTSSVPTSKADMMIVEDETKDKEELSRPTKRTLIIQDDEEEMNEEKPTNPTATQQNLPPTASPESAARTSISSALAMLRGFREEQTETPSGKLAEMEQERERREREREERRKREREREERRREQEQKEKALREERKKEYEYEKKLKRKAQDEMEVENEENDNPIDANGKRRVRFAKSLFQIRFFEAEEEQMNLSGSKTAKVTEAERERIALYEMRTKRWKEEKEAMVPTIAWRELPMSFLPSIQTPESSRVDARAVTKLAASYLDIKYVPDDPSESLDEISSSMSSSDIQMLPQILPWGEPEPSIPHDRIDPIVPLFDCLLLPGRVPIDPPKITELESKIVSLNTLRQPPPPIPPLFPQMPIVPQQTAPPQQLPQMPPPQQPFVDHSLVDRQAWNATQQNLNRVGRYCAFFYVGRCRNGDACPFLHTPRELLPPDWEPPTLPGKASVIAKNIPPNFQAPGPANVPKMGYSPYEEAPYTTPPLNSAFPRNGFSGDRERDREYDRGRERDRERDRDRDWDRDRKRSHHY